MANHNLDPESEIRKVLDSKLYPDLVSRGGLAPAIAKLARDHRIDLGTVATEQGSGKYITANMASDRGTISVLLGVEKRLFSVKIRAQSHVWATGGTDDLSAVVGVANSWREGASLQELTDEFPFMRSAALAQAYEAGDPIASQWDSLLNHSEYVELQPLLRAVHAIADLRQLFPYVSHGILRLARDPFRGSRNEIWITRLPGGGIRVESSARDDSGRELSSLHEALETALSYLR